MAAVGASARVFELLERKPLIPYKGGETPAQDDTSLSITFSHVNFSYPTRPDVPVLRDFSLSVKPGSVVALVGTSGGGINRSILDAPSMYMGHPRGIY